jgi:hypothetical protein
MTQEQWQLLLETVHGKTPAKPVTGFIIDSPWIPGWAGISTLQYYSSGEVWFQANKKAIETFPGVFFFRVSGRNTECAPNPLHLGQNCAGTITTFPMPIKLWLTFLKQET